VYSGGLKAADFRITVELLVKTPNDNYLAKCRRNSAIAKKPRNAFVQMEWCG